MNRALAHASLAAMLLLMSLWMLDTGRLAVAAIDVIFAAINGGCAFGFCMARRYR